MYYPAQESLGGCVPLVVHNPAGIMIQLEVRLLAGRLPTDLRISGDGIVENSIAKLFGRHLLVDLVSTSLYRSIVFLGGVQLVPVFWQDTIGAGGTGFLSQSQGDGTLPDLDCTDSSGISRIEVNTRKLIGRDELFTSGGEARCPVILLGSLEIRAVQQLLMCLGRSCCTLWEKGAAFPGLKLLFPIFLLYIFSSSLPDPGSSIDSTLHRCSRIVPRRRSWITPLRPWEAGRWPGLCFETIFTH